MVDPVTRYAREVVAGTVVASRLVRLACRRHITDLETATRRGLEWRPEAAQEVIDFFAEVLCLPEDTEDEEDLEDEERSEAPTPFILTPFQAFIAGSLFGWYTKRVTKRGAVKWVRRFRVGYVETGKGSGKTPFGAGLMLYLLVADGQRGAQVFSAAVTLKQAQDYGFRDAERMVEASPDLREAIDQKVNNLAVLSTGSFFRPISSEKRGLDGKRVSGALIDEEHEHPSDQVYLKIRAGTKGRPNALILVITNSGFDLESVCWRHHDYSRQILEGTIENDSWFAFVCHLDACESCRKAGKLQPSDECPTCDDWKTEGPHWLKANPNLGVTIGWDYLREQVREAIGVPSQRNMVRRLNFCQWTQQATAWIAPEQWALCGSSEVTPEKLAGRECFVGIDLSDKIDLSSVVLVFPRALNRETPKPQIEGELAIDRAIDVLPYFWMPEKTIYRRAQEDGIPYPNWVKSGHVFQTPGALIDHDAIMDFIMDTVATKYRIMGIGFDRAGATASITRLRRKIQDDLVIDVPQNYPSLSEPSKTFEALLLSGNLAHNGNPAMAMCVGNLAIAENDWNEIRPVKISSRKRIDGAVALIDALHVMQKTAPPVEPEYQMYVFGGAR